VSLQAIYAAALLATAVSRVCFRRVSRVAQNGFVGQNPQKGTGTAGAGHRYLPCRLRILRNKAVQPKLALGAIKRWGGYKK
jgi:hypothetical protein